MEATNATAELNDFRAKKGLPPFEEDACLVEAAKAAAIVRAGQHRAGHTSNDFQYLSDGCTADAAGCAAMEPSWGWHSCCDSEAWKYGGAAVVMGDDGLRYMHLFVREELSARPWRRSSTEHHRPESACPGEYLDRIKEGSS